MNEEQKNRLKKLVQKLANAVLDEMKKHFSKTGDPAPWMHDTVNAIEVESIKKIIVTNIFRNEEVPDYFRFDVKVILDGKKLARIYEPTDILDSMDIRLEEITGMRMYLFCDEVVAEDFDPQW